MTPAERSRDYRARRGEPYAAFRRVRHRQRRIANPANSLLIAARRRAKARGLSFNLTLEDIVIPKRCPVLGMVLRVDNRRVPGPNSVTLDRINSRRGYVRGNVIVVSHRANTLKRDGTPAELVAVAKFYANLV